MNRIRSILRKAARYIRDLRDYYLIRVSGLFDETWYLKNNPDIMKANVNLIFHYLRYGGFEGRDPSPNFSSGWYLDTHDELKKAKINPLVHYIKYGHKKGHLTLTESNLRRKCDFFFIIGTGRSGTTLMAQILNANSRVCVPFELQIAFEYSNNGKRLAEIFNSGLNLHFQAEDYIKLIEDRCPNKFLDFYDYHAFFLKCTYPIMSLQWLITELYTDIAYHHDKSVFAEQTPWYGQNIGLLNQLFPHARYVHMIRDGRDVAISFARTPWWSNDININLGRWASEVNKIEEDIKILLKGRAMTIRYEDLVINPDEVTRNVCGFLNIGFEKRMLDPDVHVDYSRYSKTYNERAQTSSAYQKWKREKKSAFFSDNIYGWKNNEQIKFGNISGTIKQSLRQYGYEA